MPLFGAVEGTLLLLGGEVENEEELDESTTGVDEDDDDDGLRTRGIGARLYVSFAGRFDSAAEVLISLS